MRIVHLISHPIAYNVPLYRRIAEKYPDFEVWYDYDTAGGYFDPGFDRRVEWGSDLKSGYKHRFYPTITVLSRLAAKQADVLWVHGYSSPRHLLAILMAKRHGCKVWIRGETHLRLPASPWKKALRWMILPWLFRQIDVCLYIGTWNRTFYEHYGVPKDKLVFMPYCVDNEFWMAGKPVKREPFVLYVGKLLPEKGIDRLLRVADAMPEMQFVVAGDGPVAVDRPNIRKFGFQTPVQLRDLYNRASCLIVPSRSEPFGLVVNEALCCGCPVVASSDVASAHDLITGAWSGIWASSENSLAWCVEFMLRGPLDAEMGNVKHMRSWSYEQDLQGIEEALRR